VYITDPYIFSPLVTPGFVIGVPLGLMINRRYANANATGTPRAAPAANKRAAPAAALVPYVRYILLFLLHLHLRIKTTHTNS
jgi:hypothetical protein